MKTSKFFFAAMMVAAVAVGFTACDPKGNDPDDPFKPSGDGNGDGKDTTVVVGEITSIADAIAIIDKLAPAGQTDEEYTLQGKITEIMTALSDVPTYGNINLKLTDATGTIACYYTNNLGNVKFTSADEVPYVGAEVVIKGKLKKYVKTQTDGTETVTPEVINGYFVKIISNEAPSVQEVTIAQAIEIINGLADGASTTDMYIVSGEVKNIVTTSENIAKYKNCDFWMTDGTNEIQAFRTTGVDGADFTDGMIAVGDQVKVKGPLMKYVKTDGTVVPEINKGSLVK